MTARKRITADDGPRAGSIVAGVRLTHPDREVTETDGVTKLEVARYHVAVERWLLPQIADRPLAVVKCPGGDLRHCFFQKHPGTPRARGAPKPQTPPYLHLPHLRDVVESVQNGAFEFHSWGATFPRLDRPDRITLDLDPDTALSWPAVREACDVTRALLDRLELAWFLKTTGGKGFHFVIPVVRRYGWDELKTLARGIASHLARAHPATFTDVASKQKRAGKVYVDYLRNADGATAIAAYSLRARAGLSVSLPISWSALARDVRGAHFNVRNVPALLARRKVDPWANYEGSRQRIPARARKVFAV